MYDALASTYGEHFTAAHRRAYDDLAWELVQPLLPIAPGRIVDAGCGIGRWARRLVDMGHVVVEIEPTPTMAARARERLASACFELVEQPMEDADLAARQADLVLAMGSLQYSEEPEQALQRLCQRRWVRPGAEAVLVDSLVALVLELLAAGKVDEAFARFGDAAGHLGLGRSARRSPFVRQREAVASVRRSRTDRHRGTRTTGELECVRPGGDAGSTEPRAHRQMALERRLMANPAMADVAKQLYASGRVPTA